MRKRNFSKLLVVVLALAMIAAMSVGLVACNNDKGGGGGTTKLTFDGTQLGATQYFDALWSAANNIGDTALTPSDDIKFDFTMGIQLGTMTVGNTAPNAGKIDLGAKVSLILDRKAAAVTAAEGETPAYVDGTKTAAKIQLFDASKGETAGNVLTAYYFFSDPDYAYINFKGQQVKVAFDTGLDNSSKFNGFLAEVQNGMKSSIDAAINAAIAGSGTESWSLDTVVNAVVGLLLDKESLTELLTKQFGGALEFLGIKTSDVVDENGNLTIGKILCMTSADGSGPAEMILDTSVVTDDPVYDRVPQTYFKQNADGTKYYETKLGGIVSFAAGLAPDLGTILGGEIKLSFITDANDDLDNFEVYLGMDNTANSTNAYTYPYVKINISELEIDKAPDLSSMNQDTVLGITKADYKETFDLGVDVGLNITSLKLNLSENEQIDLAGDFSLKLDANIDLATATAADNKTVLFGALVKKGATGAADVNIAEIYFKGGQLILKVNNEAKGGTVSYAKALFELAGKPIIDAIAGIKDENAQVEAMYKGFAAQVAVGLFNATTIEPANSNLYEKVIVPTTSGNVTYYYQTNYNTNFQGLVMNNVNLVTMFQNWAAKAFAPKEDTPSDTPTLYSTVFNGIYNNGKTGKDIRYYKATDNQNPLTFNFNYVLEKFTKFFTIAEDGTGVSINATSLSVIKDLIGIGKIQNYTDAACTKEGETEKGKYKIDSMDSVYAYMFARNQELINAFTDAKLIGYYGDTELYQNVNMLSAADTKLIYDCISGKKTYAQLTTDQKSKITEDAFNEFLNTVIPSALPGKLLGLLAGNESIIMDVNNTVKTPHKVMETLFSSMVNASMKLTDNGILLTAHVKVTKEVQIDLSAAITLTADKAITGSLTAPTDTNNWTVINIPTPANA